MKVKGYMLALALLACDIAAIGAATLTPQDALERWYGESGMANGPVPCFEAGDLVVAVDVAGEPCAYIFSTTNKGYAVVNADDRGVPLLGYGDGVLSPGCQLPPAMVWWLRQYSEELDGIKTKGVYYEAGNVTRAGTRSGKKPIQPLCTTKWGQIAPYNGHCPELDGKLTYTGCVAVSMAQIMKFHSWPTQGSGTHSYEWHGTRLSMDFSGIRFGWDNMLDRYTPGEYSDYQADEVARLMYAAGISVDMNYGLDGSGAEGENQARALKEYFGYGASTTLLERRYFHISDWEDILYASLDAGAPVAYMAHSGVGGHAFLLDGYADGGFFHVNWGWTGDADGYFRITALNPYEQELPGTQYGYNYDQKAVVFAFPDISRDTPLDVMSNTGTLQGAYDKVSGTVTLSGQFTYLGGVGSNLTVGMLLKDTDGNVTPYPCETVDMEPGEALGDIAVALPLPETGAYSLSPAYMAAGEWLEMSAPVGQAKSISVIVTPDGMTIAPSAALPIEAVDLAPGAPIYMNRPFEISFDLVNANSFEQGVEYWVALIVGNDIIWNWNPELAILDGNSSRHVVYQNTMPWFSGVGETAEIGLVREEDGKYMLMGETLPVDLQFGPSGFDFSGDGVVVRNPDDVTHWLDFNYGITSVKGFYSYKLRAVVSDAAGKEALRHVFGTYDFVCDGMTEWFDKKLDVSKLPGDGDYTLRLYAHCSGSDSDDENMPFIGEAVFRTAHSGIVNVIADVDDMLDADGVEVYNLAGVRVACDNLAPGIYIVRRGGKVFKCRKTAE